MAISKKNRQVLLVVMDGVGVRPGRFGNAVALAQSPWLHMLAREASQTKLLAHGKAVGLPSDSDLGNSEVGHNTLGGGRAFDQGAMLVQNALADGSLYAGDAWKKAMNTVQQSGGTLHFLGLLSDGNVHAHEGHLHAMLVQAKKEGIRRVRIHALLDGRDVPEKSAEQYCGNLERHLAALRSADFDVCVASGGGRMTVTMDRYNADWGMVQRGWDAHVEGKAAYSFSSIDQAVSSFRQELGLADQYFPAFVITKDGEPVGRIVDGDAVLLWNFRGDRAIEISRAFDDPDMQEIVRPRKPKVFYAGMMEYDGDYHIPRHFLVPPPRISETLGEHMIGLGLRQFACSETQKFGHVTYFWNGNRSGMFDPKMEEYVEVPSDNLNFDLKPWMKAHEITEVTIDRMLKKSFDFGRINYANGDMVGHTGNLEATIIAVATVDMMIGRLIQAARKTETILVVTADHGNAEEMFEGKDTSDGSDAWLDWPLNKRPSPKTAHTLNPVPFYIFDPLNPAPRLLRSGGSIGNVAATVLDLMGAPAKDCYLPSLLRN